MKENDVTADPQARWVVAVRVLALVSAILLVVALVDARALRSLRAELQHLRAACAGAPR
jgi:hypothetical protein